MVTLGVANITEGWNRQGQLEISTAVSEKSLKGQSISHKTMYILDQTSHNHANLFPALMHLKIQILCSF